MRKAFSDSLMKEAEINPQVTFMTGDLGFQVFDEFSKIFGSRYINVGVAYSAVQACPLLKMKPFHFQ